MSFVEDPETPFQSSARRIVAAALGGALVPSALVAGFAGATGAVPVIG
jgi:hypothetical protein